MDKKFNFLILILLKADKILVLEHGSVVEQGTFEELNALNGRFTKLVQDQYFWLPKGESEQ